MHKTCTSPLLLLLLLSRHAHRRLHLGQLRGHVWTKSHLDHRHVRQCRLRISVQSLADQGNVFCIQIPEWNWVKFSPNISSKKSALRILEPINYLFSSFQCRWKYPHCVVILRRIPTSRKKRRDAELFGGILDGWKYNSCR